jgi:pimeloyl-ACP methyl ester carboxylesterase
MLNAERLFAKEQTMPWQSGYVTVNGLQLHYQRTGGNKPPVVLVHGMTDYGLYWSRVARALEDSYDLVLYDMRGHGLSDAPETGYALDDYASDLLGLIAALGLDRPALVGHSLGAATTFAAAVLNSAALRCIVLEDPPWYSLQMLQAATDEQRMAYPDAWKTGNEALQQLDHAGRVAQCRVEHPTWHEEDCAAWAESKRLVRSQIFSGFVAMMAQPWRATAAQIECPALLITSDPALGGIVIPAVAEEFAQVMPNGRVVNIAGAGHAIHREQLDAFVAAVRAFIG